VPKKMLFVELAVVLALIVVNGVLAMTELAVVSARRPRLQAMVDDGSRGAAAALELADNPGRFLSSVQIGITLVGILAGALSGATLAQRLGGTLQAGLGLSEALASGIAFAITVGSITFLSLVLGELVPKQLALADAERLAARVARPMTVLARIGAPAIWLLDGASQIALRLLGVPQARESQVTEHEIDAVVAEAESAGVVEPAEKRMIAGVLRLGDLSVRALMTPRNEVEWLDLSQDEETLRRRIVESRHTRLPAGFGGSEEISGIVSSKDVLDVLLGGGKPDYRALLKPAPLVHDVALALEAMEVLRASPDNLALVVDEYGAFEGVLTTADMLEAIAGRFDLDEPGEDPPLVQRDDGSWLIDGGVPAEELGDLLKLQLPRVRGYHTVAGFVLARFRRLPRVGESFEWRGWRFEVVDMDGHRIDRVLAQRQRILHRQ